MIIDGVKCSNTPQGGTKKSTPQGGIEKNDRLSGVLSSVPSSGIEKNAPLRGKALKKDFKPHRIFISAHLLRSNQMYLY